jgi:predicted secreted protein
MAILNGTEIKVYKTGTTNLVAFAQNCTLNVNHSPREITNKESAGYKEILEGLRDFSIDIDGAYAWTNATGTALTDGVDDTLETNVLNARQAVTFIFGDTAATSDISYSGSGFITSVSITGGTEDTATYSMSIEGTGVLTQTIN